MLEEEQAWGNGNKEDKSGQSHFNLLAATYICVSSVHDHCSLSYFLHSIPNTLLCDLAVCVVVPHKHTSK